MISLLYKNCLVLAYPSKADNSYIIQASIGLSSARIEETDNARGKIVLNHEPYKV